jgi:hypothetical protein
MDNKGGRGLMLMQAGRQGQPGRAAAAWRQRAHHRRRRGGKSREEVLKSAA